ncbi:MAG: hypothetical protein JST26_03450 [Bacteroidetes bacterium]|nr:hypothetical protein [Bacteroidota bacterium]
MKTIFYSIAACAMLSACGDQHTDVQKTTTSKTDSAKTETTLADSARPVETTNMPVNDTLDALAGIIAGMKPQNNMYDFVTGSSDFISYSKTADKRWNSYDSSRITKLREFRNNEIGKIVKPEQTLFYPFSGPDILYAYTFFPDVQNYVMVGLEPVGSLPEFKKEYKDSLDPYFNKINTSLNAILKYSFFRTESMSKDLRNEEVNGTLHLLFLFLKRTGNSICSAKPITVDTTGTLKYLGSFEELKKLKTPTRGVEISFLTKDKVLKTLRYFSLNAADGGLKSNKGFSTYLAAMGRVNSYLKGASYLMHKSYFSIVRNTILNQSSYVVQDDSGIAFHYFTDSGKKWDYTFYGKYLKPISLFSQFYQKDLDSTYKALGSKDIGFGIGYNFKDKNSNFMIARRVD